MNLYLLLMAFMEKPSQKKKVHLLLSGWFVYDISLFRLFLPRNWSLESYEENPQCLVKKNWNMRQEVFLSWITSKYLTTINIRLNLYMRANHSNLSDIVIYCLHWLILRIERFITVPWCFGVFPSWWFNIDINKTSKKHYQHNTSLIEMII